MAAEQSLSQRISNEAIINGATVPAELRTSERVLARITDGIYRHPSSALRELVANAHDADADNVWIEMDAPRFSNIRVRDDGRGMSAEVLAHLIENIGGSAKRGSKGRDIGITDREDVRLSPGGRQLIGRVGIGLFSVAHLGKRFTIITKQRGSDYRLIAEVVLRAYSEGGVQERDEIKAGTVRIWSTPASDKDSQGTEIIVDPVVTKVVKQLRGRERFSAEHQPTYYVGQVKKDNVTATDDLWDIEPSLPWDDEDRLRPDERFRMLVEKVVAERGTANVRLSDVLDSYLQLAWTLSLALPLEYVKKHPFSVTGADGVQVWRVDGRPKRQAEALKLKPEQSIAEALAISTESETRGFRVFLDGLELLRPIDYVTPPPKTQNALPGPLLFVAKYQTDFGGAPDKVTGGGRLAFSAVFCWKAKIFPTDHRGVLVRIHGASGTLFDSHFMNYQISELTRLHQITAEIFVTEGLESALNIDRESFNFTHPHYQVLQNFVHGVLRQLANRQKAESKKATQRRKRRQQARQRQNVMALADHLAETAKDKRGVDRPSVVAFVRGGEDKNPPGTLTANAEDLARVGANLKQGRLTDKATDLSQRLHAIAVVLDAHGLLEDLNQADFDRLMKDISLVLGFEDKQGRAS